MKSIRLISYLFLFLNSSIVAAGTAFDVLEVNNHPGYLTAMETSPDGVLDKVLVIIKGFDTKNADHPIDEINSDFQPVIDQLQPQGWDIIIFDYVRGDIDLTLNADNLAHFICRLDRMAVPDYHLALVGGSMGGIVTRTLFVREYSNLGVDTFVHCGSRL